MFLTPVQIKRKFFFTRGGCVPCHYVGAWALRVASTVLSVPELQALVYDILRSTSAVFSYAIGSRKLSANEQFWCSNSSTFVTNNLDYITRLFSN